MGRIATIENTASSGLALYDNLKVIVRGRPRFLDPQLDGGALRFAIKRGFNLSAIIPDNQSDLAEDAYKDSTRITMTMRPRWMSMGTLIRIGNSEAIGEMHKIIDTIDSNSIELDKPLIATYSASTDQTTIPVVSLIGTPCVVYSMPYETYVTNNVTQTRPLDPQQVMMLESWHPIVPYDIIMMSITAEVLESLREYGVKRADLVDTRDGDPSIGEPAIVYIYLIELATSTGLLPFAPAVGAELFLKASPLFFRGGWGTGDVEIPADIGPFVLDSFSGALLITNDAPTRLGIQAWDSFGAQIKQPLMLLGSAVANNATINDVRPTTRGLRVGQEVSGSGVPLDPYGQPSTVSSFTISGKAEVTYITLSGTGIDCDINGTARYFLISSPTRDYYVWFSVSDGIYLQIDPILPNKLGVQVTLIRGDINSTMAIKVAAALDALSEFAVASPIANSLIIKCNDIGLVPEPKVGTAPVAILVSTKGVAANSLTLSNKVTLTSPNLLLSVNTLNQQWQEIPENYLVLERPISSDSMLFWQRIVGNFQYQKNGFFQAELTEGDAVAPLAFIVDGTGLCFTAIPHGFITGQKTQVSSTGTLPLGLSVLTEYYIVVYSPTSFKFADSMEHALAGDVIALGQGIGIHSCIDPNNGKFSFSSGLLVPQWPTDKEYGWVIPMFCRSDVDVIFQFEPQEKQVFKVLSNTLTFIRPKVRFDPDKAPIERIIISFKGSPNSRVEIRDWQYDGAAVVSLSYYMLGTEAAYGQKRWLAGGLSAKPLFYNLAILKGKYSDGVSRYNAGEIYI